MDDKDRRIIGLLRQDSRISIRAIAKETGIRPSTVHQRIQKLSSSGVIERFTIKLDPEQIGEGFVVFVLLSTSEDLDPAFFRRPEVKEAQGVTGEYDLLLKLKFPDVSAFNRFLIDFRKDKRITKTVTMVGTITLKETC
ncbi:MAG: Lrp/AsnC family transcriptional regulator [DPANN group archaeon]|nr:Lrp/AsnC family transcriptional regulator [DPANN group archaeon]